MESWEQKENESLIQLSYTSFFPAELAFVPSLLPFLKMRCNFMLLSIKFHLRVYYTCILYANGLRKGERAIPNSYHKESSITLIRLVFLACFSQG